MKALGLVKDIMDIKALLANFTVKQRLTILSVLGVFIIGLNQYPNPPQAAPGPQGKQAEDQSAAPALGILPNGYNPNAVVRDPFAVPARFQPNNPVQPVITSRSLDNTSNKVEKPRNVLPVVQGIVGSGSVRAAILSTGSVSRSYRINEYVGSYVITAISSNSVTLEGPEGTIVVPMGR